MEKAEVEACLGRAIGKVVERDAHLLVNDLSERCIAARLAFYLQAEFPEYAVDVEYNRKGDVPKRLGIPEECANALNDDGEALAVPDVIVHRRGEAGPNILALELKKSTNRRSRDCDLLRLQAFCDELHYEFGAFIYCQARTERPTVTIEGWFEPRRR